MNEKTQGGVPRSIAHVVSSTSRTLKHVLKRVVGRLRHWIQYATQQGDHRNSLGGDVPRNPPPGERAPDRADGQAAATPDKAGAL
jgi:hypothetical protein